MVLTVLVLITVLWTVSSANETSTLESNLEISYEPSVTISYSKLLPELVPEKDNIDLWPSLSKCCKDNYILKNDPQKGLSCVELPILITAPGGSSNLSNTGVQFQFFSSLSKYKIEFNESNELPKCLSANRRILDNRDGQWFKITSTSTTVREIAIGLDYFLWPVWIPINKSSYCLDLDDIGWKNCETEKNGPNSTLSNSICTQDPVLIFCELDQNILLEFTIHRYVFGVSSISTCFPILVTLFLFFHLKIHHNLRKWILMSYFTSYCIACAVHGTQILFYINSLEQELSAWCLVFNHIFLYLVCVFGTACMFISLDIFWCFLKMNSHLGVINPPKSAIISIILITWIVPLLLYVGGELWREYFEISPPDLAWERRCMSHNYGTIKLILMIQFVFKFAVYLFTSVLIYKHKKSTSFATSGAQTDFNEMKTLYAKLFVTTGMPFTCLALDYCFAKESSMAIYWFLIRFPHSFIGWYIFLVFGLSKEVRNKWKAAHMSQKEQDLKVLKCSTDSDRSVISKSSSIFTRLECKVSDKTSCSAVSAE